MMGKEVARNVWSFMAE